MKKSGITISVDTGDAVSSSDAPSYEPPLPVGYKIGEYVVESILGEGGFGAVYRGVHPVIGRSAAIKVLSLRHAADAAIVSRFVSEARAASMIRHSGIIDIFSFGQLEDGRPYYVMELLDGQTLHQLIKQRGKLSVPETIMILGRVGSALEAAHAAGIAHRDLKPENIFLTSDEGLLKVKLLDFGVAKLMDAQVPRDHRTATGTTIGTPSYMAPEQCMGRAVDHRADVYAFGIVAFEMLTGTVPFRGQSQFEVMIGHVNVPPPRPEELAPEISRDVADVVLWMLEKNVELRPRSIEQALTALTTAATGRSPGTPMSGGGFVRPQRSPTLNERSPFAKAPPPVPASSGISAPSTPSMPSLAAAMAATAASSQTPRVAAPRRATWMIALAAAAAVLVGGAALALSLRAPPEDTQKATAREETTPAKAPSGPSGPSGPSEVNAAEPTTREPAREASAREAHEPTKPTPAGRATAKAPGKQGGRKDRINELEPWE